MKLTIHLTIGGLALVVEADYEAGSPDVHYLSNGDPGYPGNPEQLEITSVKHGELELIGLIEDLIDLSDPENPLEQKVWAWIDERADEAAAGRWEEDRSWEEV